MGDDGVWILGGYQSDFARNLTREGLDFADLTAEVVTATLGGGEDRRRRHRRRPRRQRLRRNVRGARPPRRHAGNRRRRAVEHPVVAARGGVRIGQRRHARGDRRPALRGLRDGARRRRRTREDGARRHRRDSTLARPRGPATKAATPSSCGRTCSSSVADEYDRRYGIDDASPDGRSRGSTSPTRATTRTPRPASGRCRTSMAGASDVETNPVVEGRLRRFDCSQMTDGGAGIVLVTDDYLRDHPDAQPDRPHRGLGSPHRRPRPAAEARPLRGRPLRDAARPARRARRLRRAPTSRSTTSTASRCTTASPRASTWRSTTSG